MKKHLTAHRAALLGLCAAILTLSGCNLEKGIQTDIDSLSFTRAINKLNPPLDSLGRRFTGNAVMGVSDSSKKALNNVVLNVNNALAQLKLDPEVKKLLMAISTIGDTTSMQLTKVGNSLHWQIGKLSGDLNGALNKLTASLDTDAKKMVDDIIQSALNSASSTASRAKIDTLVSTLLDKNTDAKAQKLVSSALQPTIDTLSNRIDRIVHKDVPFLCKKQAGLLLAMVGAIALAIIGFVWYEKSRYSRLVKVLTLQIDKIQNKDVYNELRIKTPMQRRKKLVSSALRPTIDTLSNRIDRIVHKDVPFVQKQAGLLLAMVGRHSAGDHRLRLVQKRAGTPGW